jgi:hypothetical protein
MRDRTEIDIALEDDLSRAIMSGPRMRTLAYYPPYIQAKAFLSYGYNLNYTMVREALNMPVPQTF